MSSNGNSLNKNIELIRHQPVCSDAQGVIEKAKITPLQLEGQFLTVSSKFIPTHDQSILLAKNLNPKTSKETFINFVESTKNVDVFNVVFGKDHKAIVILKSTIGGLFRFGCIYIGLLTHNILKCTSANIYPLTITPL